MEKCLNKGVSMFRADFDHIKLCSVNAKNFVTKQGRIVSSTDYRKCKEVLTQLFEVKKRECGLKKPIKYSAIVYHIGTYKDSSNCIKVIEDALQCAGVIENDRDILHFIVHKKHQKRGSWDSLKVEVQEIDKDDNFG